MNLKKSVTFFIILFSLSASAQRIAFKGGVNFGNSPYKVTYNKIPTTNLTGFHAGLAIEFPIDSIVYFNTGLEYSRKGTKVNIEGNEVDFPIYYLELPASFALKFDLSGASLFFKSGPYVAFGLSSVIKSDTEEVRMTFGSGTEEMKRVDFGLNFGAGMEFGLVQFSVNYGAGIVNLSNERREKLTNGVLSLSLTVFFEHN
jgi:hypothetical protein